MAPYGYKSEKLHNQVEEYFNNKLALISNGINDLADSVNVVGILSSRTNLSPETISSLIKIAVDAVCSNKEYILKIIQEQNHILEDMHFVELEGVFPFLKSNSRLLLAKLFVSNSRQVESESAIDTILEELTDSNASLFISILPEAAGQVGQIIVKLKSDIDVNDKLSALNEFVALVSDNSDIWYPEIITTILQLLEHKKITAKSMEILALAVDSSNPEPLNKLMQLLKTDIKANNIIIDCSDTNPDSYSKLSPPPLPSNTSIKSRGKEGVMDC